MLKKRLFALLTLGTGLLIHAADDPAVTVNTASPSLEKPQIRTQADLERGKNHVQNVVEEIKGFFSTETATSSRSAAASDREVAGTTNFSISPEPDGRATLVYQARFTTAKELFRAIDGIASGPAMIEVIPKRNTILISDKADRINYYKNTLLAIDTPSPQILIEAKVVEVLFSDGMERNLSLAFAGKRGNVGAVTSIPGSTQTGDGLQGSWDIIGGEDNLNVSFQWLLTAQDAKVLSSPNILVSLNEVARIVTGQDIPIQSSTLNGNTLSISTTFKRVGVSLEVEPQMINSDDVTLRVFPQVTTVLRYENISTGSGTVAYPVPVISVRNVESHLRMKDKQVVTIGGLYSSRDSIQEERIPVLSDVPLIGELFTGKNKTREIVQLVFFMKIHIVPPEQVDRGYTFDPVYQPQSTEAIGRFIEEGLAAPPHFNGVKGLWDEMKNSLPKRAVEPDAVPNGPVRSATPETKDTAVKPQDAPTAAEPGAGSEK